MRALSLNSKMATASGNETGETEEGNDLIPKRNAHSVIWRWFGFKRTDSEQTTIICKLCLKKVAAKVGSTTNLFHHLKQHPLQYEECIKLRGSPVFPSAALKTATVPVQAKLVESFSHGVQYAKNSKKWQEKTTAVTFHIAKDMVPVSTVEKTGFKRLLKTIEPRYNLPSRKFFSQEALPKLYIQVREQVSEKLSQVTHFATTSDMWTSRTCEPYLSLTIHFIEGWELKSTCLQTSYFPDNHTGEVIAEGLRDALASWNLREEQQVCITTDNGSNIVKAVELNKWTRLQCFGHRLHLAVGK